MWPFKKHPFSKTIRHEDWRDYDDDPAVQIRPSEHKCGKAPRYEISSLSKTPYVKVLLDGTIMLYRGLKIWQGTPFDVTIAIEK